MKLVRPSPTDVYVALAAFKHLVSARGKGMKPAERDMMSTLQRIFGTSHDVDVIRPMGPKDVAACVEDPQIRHQLVCALIVFSLIDREATKVEAALVDAFAKELGIVERSVENLRQLVAGKTFALRFDVLRRFWVIDRLRERIAREGIGAIATFAGSMAGIVEDPELARRYAALRDLPDGTLGREYVRMVDHNGWPLPGEPGATSEIVVVHDMTHVLGGYGTDPSGEVEVASFCAGHRVEEPFAFVLFVMLQFHVGVRMTPGSPAEQGFFDLEKALAALARGAAMNIDLTREWDYWDVVDVPIEELRRRYDILPKSAVFAPGDLARDAA